jgi:hypothetical protein
MLWVDPADPSVVAAVLGPEAPATLDEETLADVRTVLAVASENLTHATGQKIHPAGNVVEEAYCTRRLRRFSPLIGPVTTVNSIKVYDDRTDAWVDTQRQWRLTAGAVEFTGPYQGFFPLSWDYGVIGAAFAGIGSRPMADIVPVQISIRIDYDYASTITPGAKRAVLEYARELWLSIYDSDSCALPERVTSVTREGLSIQLLTPTDYIDKGKVGLPRVDTWLAQVNPRRSHRPAAVYTPDSPVGVPVSNRRTGW